MTPLFSKPFNVLLLDIEGTTTPIDFVYDILFPYARDHVKQYITEHSASAELEADLRRLLEENAEDASRGLDPPLIQATAGPVFLEDISAYVCWLIARDRKSTPLKSLQGSIWEEGYLKGELRSQVFEDVPLAFNRWAEQGKKIYIYSSGSVLAQKLLFANTEAGDLTQHIVDYFDTNVGPKQEPESYRRIAGLLEMDSSTALFVSDVAAELDAAASVGFQTRLCLRPGNHSQGPSDHSAIYTFDEIFP